MASQGALFIMSALGAATFFFDAFKASTRPEARTSLRSLRNANLLWPGQDGAM
jgi:hypothetical protein